MIEFMAGWFARGASDATAEAIERKVKSAARKVANHASLASIKREFEAIGERLDHRAHTVRTGGADVVWSDGRGSFVMRNGDCNLEPGAGQAYARWREEQRG